MHDAKSRFSELVKRVLAGEKIIISKNNEPVVDLIIYKKESKKREPGVLKGQIWASYDCWKTNEEIVLAMDSSEIFPR